MKPSPERLADGVEFALVVSAGVAGYASFRSPSATFDFTMLDELGRGMPSARVTVMSTWRFPGVTRSVQAETLTAPDGRASCRRFVSGLRHVVVAKPGYDECANLYWHGNEGGAEGRLRRTPGARLPAGVRSDVAEPDDVPVGDATVVVSSHPAGSSRKRHGRTRALFPFATSGLLDRSMRRDCPLRDGTRISHTNRILWKSATPVEGGLTLNLHSWRDGPIIRIDLGEMDNPELEGA